MLKAVLIVLLFFSIDVRYGQQTKQQVYRVQVTTHGGLQLVGVLTALRDSSLQLMLLTQSRKGHLIGKNEARTIPVKEIYMLRIRNKGAAGRTALTGGIIGIFAGGLIGNLAYSPCNASTGGTFGCIQIFDRESSTIAGAVTGSIIGAGLGALAGTSSKRILLYGDYETYRQLRSELNRYVYHLPLHVQVP